MSVLTKWNTLRNQILVVFLFVMMIVLFIVGIMTFNRVSMLLTESAEEQIQNVATEANGRFESLYEQINMVTKQVATNDDVQRVLLKEMDGQHATFNERQSLMETTNTIQANADGIYTVELYTNDNEQIIPLGNGQLSHRLERKWLEMADAAKGRLIWVGEDPQAKGYFLVVRRVSIINRSFSNGGYLLTRINKNYFQMKNLIEYGKGNEYTILVDRNEKPVISNYSGDINKIFNDNKDIISIDQNEYMVVKEASDVTGWKLAILTPVSELTKGISVLRTGLIVSGIVGFIVFFICSFFLSTLITRPIINLTKTMKRGSKGTLTLNPSVASTTEINELNNTYNHLVEQTNHLIQMVYEKELVRNRTELKALQAQIHPHFLFNTLDSLYWSLEEKDEELAQIVLAMSQLFRYTISQDQREEWVTIKEEMEHIERYMQIMKMRFGERLRWQKTVPKVLDEVKIPKLLIQPLVENAILHGAGNTTRDCHVSVTIEQTGENQLMIKVRDDGPGIDQESLDRIYESIYKGNVSSEKRSGMALANVHKRLNLYYQGNQLGGMKIDSALGEGTTIWFEITMSGGEA